jgi:hypothetical protein
MNRIGALRLDLGLSSAVGRANRLSIFGLLSSVETHSVIRFGYGSVSEGI